ncbi:MAG: RHS repeat-associated core domain-containing protein, partial [Candidatus Brocadiaceae bacterium]
MKSTKYMLTLFTLVITLIIFNLPVQAHQCGPTMLPVKVGEEKQWQITADLQEVETTYTPVELGDPKIATISPSQEFKAHHGVFTITGVGEGETSFKVHWFYPGTGASGDCSVLVKVSATQASLSKKLIYNDEADSFIPPLNNASTYGDKITQSKGGVFTDAACCDVCLPPDTASIIGQGGLVNDTPDPITLHNGEFILPATDLTIPGRGFDWTFTRTYKSRITYNGPSGHNWDFNYNSRLIEITETNQDAIPTDIFTPVYSGTFTKLGSVVAMDGHGRSDLYGLQQDGSYSTPLGAYTRLTKNNDGTFALRDRHGNRKSYDSNGLLVRLEDRHGNSMIFTRDEDGKLIEVTDTLGRKITYLYNTDGRLTEVRDFINRSITFAYDGNGDLISVTSPVVTGTPNNNDFPDGKTTKYTYSSGFQDEKLNHNLLTITAPNEVAVGGSPRVINVYETDTSSYAYGRVIMQTFGGTNASGVKAGGDIIYKYKQLTSNPSGINEPVNRVTVTDRNGNKTVYEHNKLGNAVSIKEYTKGLRQGEPEFFETIFKYNEDGERIKSILPEGNKVENTYASETPETTDYQKSRFKHGNLLENKQIPDNDRGGDQPQVLPVYTYEPVYNHVRTMTDPRGIDPGYVPPNGGSNSPGRYTTTFFYDYQEGNNLNALADVMGISPAEMQTMLTDAGMQLNMGDLNGDGITNRIAGDVVKIVYPTINLLTDSNQAKQEGDTSQEIVELFAYNQFGQIVSKTDAEGNVTEYDYYPENDPDGDGKDIISGSSDGHFGYPKNVVVDTTSSPLRNSGTNPKPAKIETRYFYDPVGNIIREVNGRGIGTSYVVNQLNQRVRIIRASSVPGGQTNLKPFKYISNFAYDFNNNIVRREIENRDGNNAGLAGPFVEYTYTYDILDRLIKETREVTETEKLVTEYQYDANENRIRTILPEGNSQETIYDERDLIFRTSNACGCSTGSPNMRYNYDKNGNLIELLDGEDNNGDGKKDSILYEYDGFNRLIRTIDPVGNITENVYDPANNITKIYRYGVIGGPSPKDNSGINNAQLGQTEYFFDELNRQYQRDALLFISQGVKTKRTPVLKDGPLGATNDGRITTRYEYDRKGRRTFLIEDDGDITKFSYDGADRRIAQIDPEGNRRNYTYDKNSNMTKILETEVTQKGNTPSLTEKFTTLNVYDSLDRLVRATDNIGQTRRFKYDSRNNLIFTSDAQGKQIADPDGLFNGLINDNGNTIRYYYDGINRRIREERDLRMGGQGDGTIDTTNPFNPDGKIKILFDYDANSRLISMTDDNGNATKYAYDDANRLVSQTNADGTMKTFEYDRDDNIVQMTDENGSVVKFNYDALNRIIRKNITRASGIIGTTQQKFEYDGLSRITRIFDNNDPVDTQDDANTIFAYDSPGRLIEEVQNGNVISNQWDGDNNRLALIYPNGRKLKMTYDKLDRIDKIKDTAIAGNIADYDYIGPARLLERKYGNGIRLTYLDDNRQSDIGYDMAPRPIMPRHLKEDNTLIAGFEYGYDRVNNKMFEVRLHEFEGQDNVGDTYAYDSVYRLTNFNQNVINPKIGFGIAPQITEKQPDTTEVQYTFDGVGNWAKLMVGNTSFKNIINEVNEYTKFKGKTHVYDNRGNLINDGTNLYQYDFNNRLRTVVRKADSAVIANYNYDAFNRRVERIVTNMDALNEHVKYSYDGWREIYEKADNSNQQYVYGKWLDEPIAIHTDSDGDGAIDATFFYHDDGKSNIAAITNASGDVVKRYTYDAYGKEFNLGSGRAFVPNPYLFAGRRFDPETGNYYYRTRYENPTKGRFLQRDLREIWYDKINVGNGYTYVGNNPVNGLDPMGFKRVSMLFYQSDLDWAARVVGWFHGNNFADAADILNQVSAGLERPIDRRGICKDCLASIEIVAHGSPGGSFINLDSNGADWASID